MTKLFLVFDTVKFLKYTQISTRIFYLLRNKFRRILGFHYPLSIPSHAKTLMLIPSISSYHSYNHSTFTFLNRSVIFEHTIDWNCAVHGKLWTYNLTYFDFLHQHTMTKSDGLNLIHDFIAHSSTLRDALEPFPISLRGINWIKFLVQHDIHDQIIDDSLYAQHHILLDNLEYHLLGNHLLENGFSLLFGAYYFHDEKFYTVAKKILIAELEEQILADGAHFELSPMYHQIMLYRVLECINLIKNNVWKAQELLSLLETKAVMMLGWLQTITYTDGTIPLLNDSADGIAPTSKELFEYANRLSVKIEPTLLSASGYRKKVTDRYECIVDVGNIGPDYIPGHAHSDTFNFELRIDGKPIIVDTGLSTYESNAKRSLERSTAAHNTIMIDSREQSEVWGGFRVANRAKIVHLVENGDTITATHDGYKAIGAMHTRSFSFDNRRIKIEDKIKSTQNHTCTAFLHLHPDVAVMITNDTIVLNESIIITCSHHDSITTDVYHYAPEFNTLIPATVIKITFTQNLTMELTL